MKSDSRNVGRGEKVNPYQVIGLIAVCTLVFAAVVAGLTYAGIPLFAAFVGVYLATIWMMLSMQKRAQQAADNSYQSLNPYRINDRRRSFGPAFARSANDDMTRTSINVSDSDLAKS